MSYVVTGLAPAPFEPLYGLGEEALAQRGARRLTAAVNDRFPCRVSLEDARPGESVILLNFEHQPAATPYRSRHAIFVREGARESARLTDRMPAILAGRPLIALRAFDETGEMLEAAIASGPDVEAAALRLLADPRAAYLHAHNPVRGCYAARIDRTTS
jgi:hypothetical protein